MLLKDSRPQTAEEMNLAQCIQQGVCLPNLIQTQEDCALKADNPTQTVHILGKTDEKENNLVHLNQSLCPTGTRNLIEFHSL